MIAVIVVLHMDWSYCDEVYNLSLDMQHFDVDVDAVDVVDLAAVVAAVAVADDAVEEYCVEYNAVRRVLWEMGLISPVEFAFVVVDRVKCVVARYSLYLMDL